MNPQNCLAVDCRSTRPWGVWPFSSVRRFAETVCFALVVTMGMITSDASAQVAGSNSVRVTSNTCCRNTDFGSGTHINGIPAGNASVTWTYTVVNGEVRVTARVQGTLYYDSAVGGGCGRLTIRFVDAFNGLGDIIDEETVDVCGGGFNANDADNKATVDVTSVTSSRIRSVHLITSCGTNLANLVNQATNAANAITVNVSDILNNGQADFGNLIHAGGTPLNPAVINMKLNSNNLMEGTVTGTLFWDAVVAGSSRLRIEYMNSTGGVLLTRTFTETGPNGGNALLSSNRTAITTTNNPPFANANLRRIRLTLGLAAANATGFVGTTMVRNYAFGANTGTVIGVPAEAFMEVGTDGVYGVEWTVPDPKNWHELDTIDVRLVDEEGEVLQFRWDESPNTFSELNLRSGEQSAPALPGSVKKYDSQDVTLFLRSTTVTGSGPTGPSVSLDLHLRFKQRAVGKTFIVEARARDDEGNVQDWEPAGTITVLPRGG